MHIEFFGHSILGRQREGRAPTFSDMLLDHYNSREHTIHSGFAECSEERILYNLKRTKDIDIAIIFHTKPEYFFVPTLGRDYHKQKDEQYQEALEHQLPLYFPQITEDKKVTGNPEAAAVPVSKDDLLTALKLHKKYFYSYEVYKNRYLGALIQIDQYVTAKKIKTIHCVTYPELIPNWFKFSSGVIDYDIGPMQANRQGKWACHYTESDNAITYEANLVAFNMFKGYIDTLLSE